MDTPIHHVGDYESSKFHMAILRPKSHWQGHEVIWMQRSQFDGSCQSQMSRFSLGFFLATWWPLDSACDRAPSDSITWLGTSWTTHLLPPWWANFEFWNARPGCLGHAKVKGINAFNDSETSLFVFVLRGGGGSHSFIHPVKFLMENPGF